MLFPYYRPRRMRQKDGFRKMVKETYLTPNDLILPLFVIDGKKIKNEIKTMPGQYQLSIDNCVKVAKEAFKFGIPGVILFGIPSKKDSFGSEAYSKNGIIQKAIIEIKNSIPELILITDICLCQYTDHGHCGFVEDGKINNDITLDFINKIALSHVIAGADMLAPSDMMDGRVKTIRKILDENNFYNIPIMSYSVKYFSNYYGPFRDAANSSPVFGDRATYQMDFGNSKESLREALMDCYEGADIIMVKPALSYLDIIYRVKKLVNLPIAAYSVSGEYALIKAASKLGWLNSNELMIENLTSIKRAGADIIISYFSIDAAKIINF